MWADQKECCSNMAKVLWDEGKEYGYLALSDNLGVSGSISPASIWMKCSALRKSTLYSFILKMPCSAILPCPPPQSSSLAGRGGHFPSRVFSELAGGPPFLL